jgi:hypothetical protein
LKHLSEDQRAAAKAVASTAMLAKLWLHEFQSEYSAADVLRMAEMILQREQWLHGFGEE